MSLFNIGKKDEHGRQRRIEHRGKYLRASRTGGIALRAQAKAAGLTLTANTTQGFRVSGTPLKNTQLAMQNGRFILRGRYGRGPARLNLSKSGVTFSTRNQLGTFNWVKPNRSSAKLAGVQVRGKNAAALQIIYLFVMLLAALAKGALLFLQALAGLMIGLAGLLYRLILATPYALQVATRRWRNWRFSRAFCAQDEVLQPSIDHWPDNQRVIALHLILLGWGRGQTATQAALMLADREAGEPALMQEKTTALADCLDGVRDRHPNLLATDPRAIMARLARALGRALPRETLVETLLQADELVLLEGPRSRLQDQLLEVFADFAGLRFQESPHVKTA